MEPWPRAKFTNRWGIEETGDVAYADEKETVIRVERKPMLVETPYGLCWSTVVYETVRNQYVTSLCS